MIKHSLYEVHMSNGATFVCGNYIKTYGTRTRYVEYACQCGFRDEFGVTRDCFDAIQHWNPKDKDCIKVGDAFLPISNISYVKVLIEDCDKLYPQYDWNLIFRENREEEAWKKIQTISASSSSMRPDVSLPMSTPPVPQKKQLPLCSRLYRKILSWIQK